MVARKQGGGGIHFNSYQYTLFNMYSFYVLIDNEIVTNSENIQIHEAVVQSIPHKLQVEQCGE